MQFITREAAKFCNKTKVDNLNQFALILSTLQQQYNLDLFTKLGAKVKGWW